MHVVMCVSTGVNLLHSCPFPCSATTSSGWPQWTSSPRTLPPPTPNVTPLTSEVTAPLSTGQPTTTTWCVPLWHPDAIPISCWFCIVNVWLSHLLTIALYHFLSHYDYILSQYAQLMLVHIVVSSCCLSVHIVIYSCCLFVFNWVWHHLLQYHWYYNVMSTIITINGSTSR